MGQIKDLSVSFLSLVKAPATGKGLTLKSKKPGERAQVFELTKTDNDRMVAYGIVYAPDQVDAHGDQADDKAIRRAAYEFMREARLKNIDTEHSFTAELAFVAESWLVRKGDELFPDEPEGSWAVGIQIGDPDLWEKLKSGDLTGLSLAGIARMDPEPSDPPHTTYTEKDAAPSWFKNWLEKTGLVTPEKSTEENTDMDAKEVRQIVGEVLKSDLPDLLKDAVKSAGSEPTGGTGAAPETPPATPAATSTETPTDIEKAVEAAVTKAVGDKIDDAVAKAVAKGAIETDPALGATGDEYL